MDIGFEVLFSVEHNPNIKEPLFEASSVLS